MSCEWCAAAPASDGDDVPARLDAAAEVLDGTGRKYPAAALRGIARVLRRVANETSTAPPEVRAAVAAALARPTERVLGPLPAVSVTADVVAHTPQPAEPRPEVVTLCGSMRFLSQMLRVAAQETAAGRIVLAPFSVVPREDQHGEHKAMLDQLHRRKIDLSLRIIVVSDGTGYYGTSTEGEIAYARNQGKQVDLQWIADEPAPPAPADPHLAHYLALPTHELVGLRRTLIEGKGNVALFSAVEQEIARRDRAVLARPTERES